jgi:micrococcal nuclease
MRRVLVIIGGALAAACTHDAPTPGPVPGAAVVEFVIDGDTIDIVIDGRDERVRLIGIDTPESRIEGAAPECYGPEATEFTTDLLPAGTAVRLERDVVGRDDYGRLLAYVYRLDDGAHVNETIARQGYARALAIAPNLAFRDRIVAATVAAEAENLGLWAACNGG